MNRLVSVAIAAMVAAAASAAVYEVGPERGLKTPMAALAKVRADRLSGAVAADERVTVRCDRGVYALPDGIEFTKKDSDLEWLSVEPLGAKLVGGTFLKGEDFAPLTDDAVLQELPEEIRGKVLVCDLTDKVKGEFEAYPDSFGGLPPGPLLYINHEEATIARWPNLCGDGEKEWTSFTNVTDHGWAEPDNPDPAKREDHAGAFIYDKTDRAKRWDPAKGVWMHGYWHHDWCDVSARLGSYDPATKEMRLATKIKNHIGGGTIGRSSRRFYVFNVLAELDQPGEWFLDRKAKKLYLYPKGDLKGAEIVLGTLTRPVVMIRGSNVVLKGFDVKGSHRNGIQTQDGSRITIDGCRVTHVGETGIIAGGAGTSVVNCEVAYVGGTGISMAGGDRKKLVSGGNLVENCHVHHYALHFRTYHPALVLYGCGIIARHNEFHDAPHNAILFNGNDIVIELNEIYNCVTETSDSGAIYTGRSWDTQGNVIRHNYIHDCGPKDGHIMGTVGVYFDDCDCGDAVYGNVFARVGRAVFIGGGRDHPVENNVFYDCYNAIQMDNRGMTWKQWNTDEPSWNFEEKCEAFNYRTPPWSERYPRLAKIMGEHPREPLDNPFCRNVFVYPRQNEIGCYPGVTNVMERLAPIKSNLGLRRKGYKPRADTWRYDFGADIVLTDTAQEPYDLGFTDPAHGDFTLKPGAAVLKLVPGFVAIPFEKIGRTK